MRQIDIAQVGLIRPVLDGLVLQLIDIVGSFEPNLQSCNGLARNDNFLKAHIRIQFISDIANSEKG